MARSGVTKTKMLFLREAKMVWRGLSKAAEATKEVETGKRARGWTTEGGGDPKGDVDYSMVTTSSWVPHPRTGIYFPKGHDHVMDDVPDGAASFEQTHWFRIVDGVDKPDQDVSTYQY